MSRRSATRAVTAAAGIALVAIGGVGLLTVPTASAEVQPADICIIPGLICIPTGGSSSAAPTTPPASSPTSSAPTSSAPATTPSDPSSAATVGSPSTTYTVGAAPAATQAAPSGPPAGPNLTATGLVVRKLHGKLDAFVTITNTGTVLLRHVPLNVAATGLGTQRWTITLNPGQHLSFHVRWPYRAQPAVKKVVMTIDPHHVVAQTTRADDRISRTKRFR